MPIDLMTKQGENLLKEKNTPWEVYPRPQLKRYSYVNLNGNWDFTVTDRAELPENYEDTILVPFCPESQLSGLQFHPEDGKNLYYRRKFTLPEGFQKDRVILHVGAADQIAEVYVNQKRLCTHVGGYEAFSVDITHALSEENELVIRVIDDLRSTVLPYGKQVRKRGGMWYTPVSGIWQTVWLESVPQQYIQKLKIMPQGNTVTITTEPAMDGTVTVDILGAFSLTNGVARVEVENPRYWSPEDPYLYNFTVTAGEDRVESYFALRMLEIKQVDGVPRLCLNGKPYFFHGLLDQGYWPDGLFTPANPECYAEDILAMKELGFNTLRKHIKVEPEEFYYQCDRLGMVVFQDMVNNGDYSFFRDTALPTVGIQKMNDRRMHRDKATRQAFLEGMAATVEQLFNHPSICYWTIFNEGWGQFDSDWVYEELKKLDDSRFIDTTSGWFRRKKTDVDSRHVYFRKVKLKPGKKPLVLSEFGGYSYKPEGHVFNTEQTYGYGKCATQEELEAAVEKLYLEQIVPAFHAGLCAAIYTQVSDIEDETNGLVSYDRKITKVSRDKMLSIAKLLK